MHLDSIFSIIEKFVCECMNMITDKHLETVAYPINILVKQTRKNLKNRGELLERGSMNDGNSAKEIIDCSNFI